MSIVKHSIISLILLTLQFTSLEASDNPAQNDEESKTLKIHKKHIVLPHKANDTATVPVNFTFTYPDSSSGRPKPLVLLLNGASVESFWYTRVIENLARHGFVVASSDYYRALPQKTSILPRPGCRKDAIVYVSARLINTVYDFIESSMSDALGANIDLTFLQQANVGQLLLLSHSLGGFVACDVLTGGCDVSNAFNSDACEGYTPVFNKEGKNVVIGTVAFEGYLADSKAKPREIALPDGTFVLYLAGQYSINTRDAYLRARKTGSCVSYISFHNMTHYGMNDFVSPPESHQVTPCASPLPADDPNFTTDEATQNAGVDLIADIINAAVSVREHGSHHDVAALEHLADQPRVLEAMVDAKCLKNEAFTALASRGIAQ